jgi:hypothetical protein
VKVLGFAGQAGVARNVSPAQASPIGIEPAAPKRWFIRSFREYLLIKDFCYRVKRKSITSPQRNDMAGKDLTDREKYLVEDRDSRLPTGPDWRAFSIAMAMTDEGSGTVG